MFLLQRGAPCITLLVTLLSSSCHTAASEPPASHVPLQQSSFTIKESPIHPHYSQLFSNIVQPSKLRLPLDNSTKTAMTRLGPVWTEAKTSLIRSLSSTGSGRSGLNVGDSARCREDFSVITSAVQKGEIWAVKVFDSWGKPDTGILRSYPSSGGALSLPVFTGDYDECRGIDTGATFRTGYFYETLVFKQLGPVILPDWLPLGMVGICAPDTCSATDVQALTNEAFSLLPNVTAAAYTSTKEERDLPLTDKAKAVIAVCSIFATLLVVGTVYDILVVRGLWNKLFEPCDCSEEFGDSRKYSNNGRYGSTADIEGEPLLRGATTRDVQQTDEYSPNWKEKFILSFSIMTNGEKLLSTKTGPGAITCINGIRFLSMTWVILGHTFIMGAQAVSNFDYYMKEAYPRWTFQAVINALVSVDSFFTISGLLMSYLVMKELEKKRLTPGFFGKFYFHRYWRLTPPYMLVLMTYVPLFKYCGDGPFWPQQGVDIDECEDTWWTNMLYLNNFVRSDKMCMGWSWYLANDMQFYIISPLIFIPLFYFGTPALLVPLAMLVGNAITSGVLTSANDLPPGIDLANAVSDYFSIYYIKPYSRIGPYLVGMITGYILNRTKCQAKLSKVQVTIGWILAFAVALAVLYGPYDNYNGTPMSTGVSALFNALHRIAWGAALSWLIFACASGYGGFINTILSWRALIPLSRLTYCAYLVHPLVLYHYFYSQRTRFYMNDGNVIYLFLGSLFMAYMVAFVASLAYEAPFLGLEKVLMAGVGWLVRRVTGRSSRSDEFQDDAHFKSNGVLPHSSSARNKV